MNKHIVLAMELTASLAAAFFASPAWSADDVQSVARSPSNSVRASDG